MAERFKSKMDWWIGLLIWGCPILAIGAMIPAALTGEGLVAMAIGVGTVVVIYGGLVFPMEYVVAPDALVIRFGLIRSRVDYASIKKVNPTRNPLSNPALSLDRLHVDSGSSLGPCISPADKEGFLRALAEKTPHLRLEGTSLVPAPKEATDESA